VKDIIGRQMAGGRHHMSKAATRAGMGGILLWAGVVAGVPGEAAAFGPQAGRPGAPPVAGSRCQAESQLCDPSEIARLESEARELAVAEGCEDVSQCRTAPLGAMACGGPRDYVVYCEDTTDEQALQRALDRLARREDRFNRQCGILSICVFITPPEVELVEGECRAVDSSSPFLLE
jgi:hypothetical protein